MRSFGALRVSGDGRGDWGRSRKRSRQPTVAVNPRQHSQPTGHVAAEMWRQNGAAALGTHSLRLAVTLRCDSRTNAVRLNPIILHSWGQGFNMRREARNLPHLLLTQRVAPGRHTRVANTIANHIIGVPLRVIDWIQNELRYGRIKRMFQRARLIIECAVK